MKKILMVAVFVVISRGAYAEDFRDMQTLKAADIKGISTVTPFVVTAQSKARTGEEVPEIISARQFMDALSMDRISPVLRYHRISEETFRTEIGSKLPSNLADVPVNYVAQVLGEASGLEARQDGGFATQHRVRIRKTLTDMSLKFDPNNSAAALVSNQHVWEWGCKREVSYLGKSCEPENQLLMKEFIKIP